MHAHANYMNVCVSLAHCTATESEVTIARSKVKLSLMKIFSHPVFLCRSTFTIDPTWNV